MGKYRVRLLPNWTSGEALAKLWEESGQIMTTPRVEMLDLLSSTDDPDFWVIINAAPSLELPPPEKCIIFYMEPRRAAEQGDHDRKSWGASWATPDPAKFLQVREYHHYPNNAEWHLTKACLESPLKKMHDQVVTAVVSAKRIDRGHHLRLDFLHFAEKTAPDLFRIWGQCEIENFVTWQGTLPPNQKDAALLPYKYHLAAENNQEKNYFTEKIVDAIMAECLCFYWGCPNLPRWLDPRAFIYVDLANPPQAMASIYNAVLHDAHAERLPAIIAMKEKIRGELTLVPTLDRIFTALDKDYIHTAFDQVIVINLDASTERWTNMERQFSEVGIRNYTRLLATDREMAARMVRQSSTAGVGWKLPDAHVGRPEIDHRAQLGQLGCKMSHWRAIALAKKKRWRRVLIVEDDAIFTRVGMQRFNLAMQEIEDRQLTWDLLWVFGLYYTTQNGITFRPENRRAQWLKREIIDAPKDSGDLVHPLKGSCSTVCYGIQSDCYDRVLDEIYHEKNGSLPVDDLFYKKLHPVLRSYIMLPCPVGADLENESTITGPSSESEGADRPDRQEAQKSSTTGVVELLCEKLKCMLDHKEPYQVFSFWNTQVRPHLGLAVLTLDQAVKQKIDEQVTRMVPLFEEHLDGVDTHRFLWDAHNVDRLDFVERVCDILHVTSYYQGYDALSVRAASSLRKKLIRRGAPQSHVDDLDHNAKFARNRFHNRLVESESLAQKMQVCGFQTHVINLDRRPDRLKSFMTQMSALHLDASIRRFPAVDGQTLEKTKQLQHVFRNNDFGSNRGALGAALSHLTLWRELMEGGADAFLIFEDDVQLLAPFQNGQWIDAYERLNVDHPDWDACFLAFIPSPAVKMDDFLPPAEETEKLLLAPLVPEMTWGGFSAYWISRKGAAKMVQFIDKHGIQHGIDYILMRMRHPELEMENYLVVPNPCFAQWVTSADDGVDTDIQKQQPAW